MLLVRAKDRSSLGLMLCADVQHPRTLQRAPPRALQAPVAQSEADDPAQLGAEDPGGDRSTRMTIPAAPPSMGPQGQGLAAGSGYADESSCDDLMSEESSEEPCVAREAPQVEAEPDEVCESSEGAEADPSGDAAGIVTEQATGAEPNSEAFADDEQAGCVPPPAFFIDLSKLLISLRLDFQLPGQGLRARRRRSS